MFKYTPFFKVLEHIFIDSWTDIELDFEEKLSVGVNDNLGLSLTYHRIYKQKDVGEVLSHNLAHCDDEETVGRASEGSPPEFNKIISKIDSAESREKAILFSIFKERMKFVYDKMRSELGKKAKEELDRIKVIINEESEKFLKVANENYPSKFPKDWGEFQELEKAEIEERMKEQQEDPDCDPEYTIRMRFV